VPSKKLFFASVVLFVLVGLPLISSVGASLEMWSQTYGGASYEYASYLVETSDGGYAITGGTTSFGAGEYDFWLIKTNKYGNMEWNQTYGGTKDDYAKSLVETSDGGYAIAGYTGGKNDLIAPERDFWLVKTDASGNMEWNKTYGGINDDYARSLIETSDGGYALAGSTDSFGAGKHDFWLIKTDGYGNMEWNKTYGGADYDYAHSLVGTSDGGYALAGNTGAGILGGGDFWLIKTDGYGNMEWNQTYESGTVFSLVETSGGGYTLAGYTRSFGAGGDDFWLVKTNEYGNMEWNQTYGGTNHDIAHSLVETSDGGYALAGETSSFGAGYDDFWLVKTDANGNMEWNQTYGGVKYEEASCLVELSDGGYALAGWTGEIGPISDFWVVRTDEYGIPEFPSWTILPLTMLATLIVILMKRRRL